MDAKARQILVGRVKTLGQFGEGRQETALRFDDCGVAVGDSRRRGNRTFLL